METKNLKTKADQSYNTYYYSDLVGEARDWSFLERHSFEELQKFARSNGRAISCDIGLGDSCAPVDQFRVRDEIIDRYLMSTEKVELKQQRRIT